VKNLVKISKSVDVAFGALAVCKDSDKKLVIWGAVDQEGQRTAYAANEARSGPESPGVLQIRISGVGALEIYRDYLLLGALRQGRLSFGFSDVLARRGPIRSLIHVAIDNLIGQVRGDVGEDAFQRRDHWAASISSDWQQTLARILLRLQRYAHGGGERATRGNQVHA